MTTRKKFIETARKYVGTKFSHQGRTREYGMDCGGLILVVAGELGLSELEFLGYSDFPVDGQFERLLLEHADDLFVSSSYPHSFTGEELKPGDLFSFDYRNGEGTRHIGIVTKWDNGCYWIIDAQPNYGISEHPLKHPFSRADLKGWQVRGLED